MAYQPKSYRKFLATSMTAAMVATAVAPVTGLAASSFPDVAEGTPYTEPINALAKMGVIKGYEDGTFKIRQKVTRAEAAQIITQLRKLDTSASAAPFSDVKQNVWYTQGINAAYNAGIIAGKGDNKFEPNVNLTRAEFALIVMKAYGIEPKKDAENKFSDVEAGQWYTEAVLTLAADKVIVGKNDTTFAPHEHIDRGDLAILAYTAEQKYGDGIVGDTQIKAVNNTTVEITYKEEVKGVKASDFEISGLKVENAVVKQSDSKTVVLTTAKQKGGEKYTVKQNGKEIGKFDGISAVIPEKITLAETAIQGVVGKQVTLKADVGVKEAGIPVTFNVQAQVGSLNKSHVEEVLTNADGIAEYSYTQYTPAYNDDVAVYPTGAPAHRAVAKVFWGANQILKVEADDKLGDKVNNNETKKYKVTYNDPKTGKPVPGAKLHVTYVENVNVSVDKTSKATVNGINPVQLTNGDIRTAEVTTNSNGVATFTANGANTKVTPVVYVASEKTNRLDNDNLRVQAKQLQFGAIQTEYKIDVTRDGGEEAAVGYDNGRQYKISVKDKDGKAVQNETLNVAFNEDLDRDMNTSTKAKFVDKDGKLMTDYQSDAKQITVKLDKNGEAKFYIATDKGNKGDYATPLVWINTNSSNASDKSFNDGHPHQKGAITYFAEEKLTSGVVEAYANGSSTKADLDKDFKGTDKVTFKFFAANQSGKIFKEVSGVDVDARFSITNTGKETIRVGKTEVLPGRTEQVTMKGSEGIEVLTGTEKSPDKTTSVKVEANGYTTYSGSNKDQYHNKHITSKTVEAKFVSSSDVAVKTGEIKSIDVTNEKITFKDGVTISYKDGKDFEYKGTINKDRFIGLILTNLADNKDITVTGVKDKDGDKYTKFVINGTLEYEQPAADVSDLIEKNKNKLDVEKALTKFEANKPKELTEKYLETGKVFYLPSKVDGVDFTWKSGDKNIIDVTLVDDKNDTHHGEYKVTVKQGTTKYDEVTLTATLSKGKDKAEYSEDKKYDLIVKGDGNAPEPGKEVTLSEAEITAPTNEEAAVQSSTTIDVSDLENGDTVVFGTNTFTKAATSTGNDFADAATLASLIDGIDEFEATDSDDIVTVKAAVAGKDGDKLALTVKDVKLPLTGGKDKVEATTGELVLTFSGAVSLKQGLNISVVEEGATTATNVPVNSSHLEEKDSNKIVVKDLTTYKKFKAGTTIKVVQGFLVNDELQRVEVNVTIK